MRLEIKLRDQWPNHIAGAAAGWKSRVIEMPQVVLYCSSGSAQLWNQ
jgi:hypothetical protein